MASILRGPLQGPRLILALFLGLLFFFYLRSGPTDGPEQGRTVAIPNGQSTTVGKDGAPIISPGEVSLEIDRDAPSAEKEKESMSDRFLEYLQGHSSHGSENHSPVPHAEHANGAAPPVIPLAEADTEGTTPTDPFCKSLPSTKDVLVVVRTPASELYSQLPAHFFTTLRCVDFLLYSTVHQNIGPYTVHDALANISDARRAKHRDFELYDKLQSAQNFVTDLHSITEDNDHNLDKWTIIPHVVDAYKQYPDKKWFVFIESDTYLSVSNMLPWLAKLDHEQDLFAGAQVMIGDVELAHSGSGIILSQTTASKLFEQAKARTDAWQDMVGASCCGDKILAEALKEVNVTLHRSFPMIQGETPFSLDWSERHWCRTAMTWHRMTPSTLDMLWQFESSWVLEHSTSGPGSAPPMLFRDYFQTFLIPLLRTTHNRTDWDNLANSLTYTDSSGGQFAHYSFAACRAACDLRLSCVQYAWEPNKCRLGTVVRLGEKVASDKRMMSGWNPKRVEKFGAKVDACTAEKEYLMPMEKNAQDEMKLMEEERKKKEEDMIKAEEERTRQSMEEKSKKEKAEKEEEKKKKEMDKAKEMADKEGARIQQELVDKQKKAKEEQKKVDEEKKAAAEELKKAALEGAGQQ
jgi:Fringe-like